MTTKAWDIYTLVDPFLLFSFHAMVFYDVILMNVWSTPQLNHICYNSWQYLLHRNAYWSCCMRSKVKNIVKKKVRRKPMDLKTGPAGLTGSTENRPLIRSNYDKKPKILKKPLNSKNRPVQLENRKNRRSNQLITGWQGFSLFWLFRESNYVVLPFLS